MGSPLPAVAEPEVPAQAALPGAQEAPPAQAEPEAHSPAAAQAPAERQVDRPEAHRPEAPRLEAHRPEAPRLEVPRPEARADRQRLAEPVEPIRVPKFLSVPSRREPAPVACHSFVWRTRSDARVG